MDAFFAAIEERDNPSLCGLPIVVGADPRGGKGRGVVSTANYKAREYGIHSALPISKAWWLSETAKEHGNPPVTFLPVRMERYTEVSAHVMETLRRFVYLVEQASIDEAYFDLSSCDCYALAEEVCRKIKRAIREEERLIASVGIGPNKLIAKIASGLCKPDGLTVVREEDVAAFLAPLPVNAISGVGEKTERVLAGLGIRTIGDLAAYPGKELTKVLGRNAVWLWGIAQGIEALPVEERPDPKSISVERTFERDVTEWGEVLETLDSVADNVFIRARNASMSFRLVGVKIRFEGFVTHTRDRTLPNWTLDREVLMATARELVAEFKGSDRPVRMLGVRVANLRKPKGKQASLPA